MSETVERARRFVALELPDPARSALVRWRAPVVDRRAELRAVAPEALHVTLCFLGWRQAAEIDSIAAACAGVAVHHAVALRFAAPGWLPRRRPRVLAVTLEDADHGLAAVHATLSESLARGGWYVPESRPFLAHVTVARVAGRARIRAEELPPVPPTELTGTTVTLFRSRLARGGARYEALHSVELSGASPGEGGGVRAGEGGEDAVRAGSSPSK